uniref:EB domain-containing protein n=1 Tax=Meloidogyne hapla TaxID=6305 RepID=A0A1I8BXT7_MELHA
MILLSFGLIIIIYINFIHLIEERINNKQISSIFSLKEQIRNKRQQQITYPPIYHICGIFPNFIYSLLPCQVCRNGGRSLNTPCTSPIQCVIYYTQGPTECIDSQCCTVINSLETVIVQPSIQFEQQNRQQSNYLIEEQSEEACGGQMAIERCESGTCSNGLICTASQYCCQCKVGRSAGYCNMGVCPSGYQCQGGFCCASCPDNTMPFGVCTAGDSTNYNLQYTNGQRQLGCPNGK